MQLVPVAVPGLECRGSVLIYQTTVFSPSSSLPSQEDINDSPKEGKRALHTSRSLPCRQRMFGRKHLIMSSQTVVIGGHRLRTESSEGLIRNKVPGIWKSFPVWQRMQSPRPECPSLLTAQSGVVDLPGSCFEIDLNYSLCSETRSVVKTGLELTQRSSHLTLPSAGVTCL